MPRLTWPPAVALPHLLHYHIALLLSGDCASRLDSELSERGGCVLFVLIALVWHGAGPSQMLAELK